MTMMHFWNLPWRRMLLMAIAAGVLAAAGAVIHPRPPAWRLTLQPGQVTLAMVAERATQQPLLWVDARSAAEYAERHVPGAVHCDEMDWNNGLMRVLEAWHPGTLVVVYCDALLCNQAEAVAGRLRRETGFDDIVTLQGGWRQWQAP